VIATLKGKSALTTAFLAVGLLDRRSLALSPALESSMKLLPTRKVGVTFKEVTDGAVLLSMEDEIYFGLNEVGSQIWQLLPPRLETFDDLCSEMSRLYPDVDPEVLRIDLDELIEQLVKGGLVQPR
jgi:hypothetical protein